MNELEIREIVKNTVSAYRGNKSEMTLAMADRLADAVLAEAKRIGSDYIVVGRPITAAPDPVAAYERCCAEFIG